MKSLKLLFAALITGVLSAPLMASADTDPSYGRAYDNASGRLVGIMFGEGGARPGGPGGGKGDLGGGKDGGDSTEGEGGA